MTRFEIIDSNLYLVQVNEWNMGDGIGPTRSTLKWKLCRVDRALTWVEQEREDYRAIAVQSITADPVGSEAAWGDAGEGRAYFSSKRPGFKFFLAGDRKADIVTREPIPCPKVRKGIETRYHHSGGWQKYLSSKGWVSA